jgi:hypothetical protein
MDRLDEQIHVGQERKPARSREIRQPISGGIVSEKNAIARQEPVVADDGETGRRARQQSRVLATQRGPYPVCLPFQR